MMIREPPNLRTTEVPHIWVLVREYTHTHKWIYIFFSWQYLLKRNVFSLTAQVTNMRAYVSVFFTVPILLECEARPLKTGGNMSRSWQVKLYLHTFLRLQPVDVLISQFLFNIFLHCLCVQILAVIIIIIDFSSEVCQCFMRLSFLSAAMMLVKLDTERHHQ